MVAFFGPTDLTASDLPEATKPILTGFIGGPVEEKREEYKKASPVSYVDAGDAPTLLIQGTKDPLVPHSQAYAMIEAMTKAGVAGRADVLVGAGQRLARQLRRVQAHGREHDAVPDPAPAGRAGRRGSLTAGLKPLQFPPLHGERRSRRRPVPGLVAQLVRARP